MLIRIVQLMLLFCCMVDVSAQTSPLQPYDVYRSIGLAISVPDTWTHDGMTTTTKAEFIGEFGYDYQQPDRHDIWRAHGSFNQIEIDSTLVPSDSAYTIHFLTIFMARARTLYKQWLCRHGKQSLLKGIDFIPPGATIVRETELAPPRQLNGLGSVYGNQYELVKSGTLLPTVGRVYSFSLEERCYRIKIESTSADKLRSIRLHERIISSLSLVN